MATSLKIDDVDEEIVRKLKAEACRQGVDVNSLARQLLENGLGLVTQTRRTTSPCTLEDLAGTWSDEDATAFLAAVSDLSRIDEAMWR